MYVYIWHLWSSIKLLLPEEVFWEQREAEQLWLEMNGVKKNTRKRKIPAMPEGGRAWMGLQSLDPMRPQTHPPTSHQITHSPSFVSHSPPSPPLPLLLLLPQAQMHVSQTADNNTLPHVLTHIMSHAHTAAPTASHTFLWTHTLSPTRLIMMFQARFICISKNSNLMWEGGRQVCLLLAFDWETGTLFWG